QVEPTGAVVDCGMPGTSTISTGKPGSGWPAKLQVTVARYGPTTNAGSAPPETDFTTRTRPSGKSLVTVTELTTGVVGSRLGWMTTSTGLVGVASGMPPFVPVSQTAHVAPAGMPVTSPGVVGVAVTVPDTLGAPVDSVHE